MDQIAPTSSTQDSLARLAEVAVRVGLNLRAGQEVVMTASIDALPLVRLITDAAYKAGATLVTTLFSDDQQALSRYRHAAPEALLGNGRVEQLRIKGIDKPLDVGTAVSAIGYRTATEGDLPQADARGMLANDSGRIAPGLYVVGWAKRGPSGTIPTNRAEAKAVADLVLADFANDTAPAKPGCIELDKRIAARGVAVIDWNGWKRIEATETAGAKPGSPRAKLVDWDDLHRAALVL